MTTIAWRSTHQTEECDGVGPAQADAVVSTAVGGRAASGKAAAELVAAIPLTSNEHVYAVVRAAVPASAVEARVHRAWIAMAVIAIAALLLAAVVARRQTCRMVRPVQDLAEGAAQFGDGDFSVHPRRDWYGGVRHRRPSPEPDR